MKYKKVERTTYPLRSGMEYRVWPHPDQRVPVVGPYSEVMMHFGLADKSIEVALVRERFMNGELPPDDYQGRKWVCQVYKDGQPFSFPILTGEGGFYSDNYEGYYVYADASRLNPIDLPVQELIEA